jgi:predicted nucleic acid-binding protein
VITAIVDTSSIISLSLINKLDLIEEYFGKFAIPRAVLNELVNFKNPNFPSDILSSLSSKVKDIKGKNHLKKVMDYGESNARILIIDDKKARQTAELLGVKCIGSIGIIIRAKQLGENIDLNSVFAIWMENNRYFSKSLMAQILKLYN